MKGSCCRTVYCFGREECGDILFRRERKFFYSQNFPPLWGNGAVSGSSCRRTESMEAAVLEGLLRNAVFG